MTIGIGQQLVFVFLHGTEAQIQGSTLRHSVQEHFKFTTSRGSFVNTDITKSACIFKEYY